VHPAAIRHFKPAGARRAAGSARKKAWTMADWWESKFLDSIAEWWDLHRLFPREETTLATGCLSWFLLKADRRKSQGGKHPSHRSNLVWKLKELGSGVTAIATNGSRESCNVGPH
jgi:hypothetical protein